MKYWLLNILLPVALYAEGAGTAMIQTNAANTPTLQAVDSDCQNLPTHTSDTDNGAHYKRLFSAEISNPEPDYEHQSDSIFKYLDEIDVVAVKYNPDFRRMNISGTHVDHKRAESMHVYDIKGLSGAVPNFHIPEYGSRMTSSIYVRGIGARMDQPAVGMTVDNVGLLSKDAYDFDISDISSFEMLRGPQSTLFGRNTMTGLINVRTLSALQYQGWRGLVEIGTHERFKFNLGWYHRFNDKTGLSFAGSFFRYRGNYTNKYNKSSVDKEVNGSLRAKQHWFPTRDIRIHNTLYTAILNQGGYAYESVASGEINYNDTCFYHRFLLTDGLTVNARFGNLDLVSVTSVQYLDDNMTLDQDFLPESYFTLTQKKKETALTEDLLLRGSAFSGAYKWMAGVYGFYRHLDMKAPVTFKETGIDRLIVSHRNDANRFYPIRWNDSEFPLNSNFKMPSGGFAVYHESRYALSNWQFTLGLRLDYECVKMRYDSFCNTSYTIYKNPSGTLPMPDGCIADRTVSVKLHETGRLKNDYLMFLPKISIVRELNALDQSNVYFNIGEGYKAGGFNTQMFSDVLQQRLMAFMGLAGKYDVEDIVSYKPEKSWTFEAGTHINLFQSKMMVDFSIFYIDCRDQQMTVFPNGTTTGRLMTNAGKTRSLGGELSINYTPLERLNFLMSYGFTDSRFVKFNDGIGDYKGKRLPYAPSNTLFAQAMYDLPCSTTGKYFIRFSVDFNGTGDIYWNEANTLRQKFYGLLGASISYQSPKWSVELWGRNLTCTDYYTFYFKSMGNEFRQRGAPITLGVAVRANF